MKFGFASIGYGKHHGMIIMWFTIAIYFDFSHVPSYLLFVLSCNKFNV